MNKKELIIVGILTILIAFMDKTGIPSAFFINVCALPYCFSSISGYANLTLYIILPTYLLLGIYSMNIIKQEKME